MKIQRVPSIYCATRLASMRTIWSAMQPGKDRVCWHRGGQPYRSHRLSAFNDPSVPGFTNDLPGDEVRRAPLCESDLAERALEKDRILLPTLVQSCLALNRESVWQRTRCATPHHCGMPTVTLDPQFDEVDLEP